MGLKGRSCVYIYTTIGFLLPMRVCFLLTICFLILTSCSKRNLIYFSDLPEVLEKKEVISKIDEPTIQPFDNISIDITTLNPETNQLFNVNSGDGYRVDNTGAINFPILGRVEFKGLTVDEATEKLTKLIEKEAKNPIVNLKITNFSFTIVGEVSSPNTYNVSSGKINIIEAIGLAGDMTPYGKRENVLLIRVQDGVRTTARLNLNTKDVFSSPYFYLKQNDLIYVESDRQKSEQSNLIRSNITFGMSIISFLLLVILQFK